MRYLVALAVILSGCGLNPQYREARDTERLARYENQCVKLGFTAGTEKMAECKLQLKIADEQPTRSAATNPQKTCITTGAVTQCN